MRWRTFVKIGFVLIGLAVFVPIFFAESEYLPETFRETITPPKWTAMGVVLGLTLLWLRSMEYEFKWDTSRFIMDGRTFPINPQEDVRLVDGWWAQPLGGWYSEKLHFGANGKDGIAVVPVSSIVPYGKKSRIARVRPMEVPFGKLPAAVREELRGTQGPYYLGFAPAYVEMRDPEFVDEVGQWLDNNRRDHSKDENWKDTVTAMSVANSFAFHTAERVSKVRGMGGVVNMFRRPTPEHRRREDDDEDR